MRFFSSVVTALAAAAILLSCGSAAPTNPSVVAHLQISGPSTVPPGSTAQYSAKSVYSDGSTKDVTASVQWHSSDPSILTISATGLASAVAAGDAAITVADGSGLGASLSIVVVPAGTFRLSGTVTGFGASVWGAAVQVTAGVGVGLSTTTDFGGNYRLYGVAGPIEVTVSKAGFVAATRDVTVASNSDALNFQLATVNQPPNLAGTYTLRITADPACAADGAGALPGIARDRSYTAALTQDQSHLHVVLSGATFVSGANGMYGSFAPDGTALFFLESYLYYKTFDFAELLPDGSGHVYFLSGDITTTLHGADLVGMFDGAIVIRVSSTSSTVEGQCRSTHHAVTFTKQGSTATGMRSRR